MIWLIIAILAVVINCTVGFVEEKANEKHVPPVDW